jgi:DNA-binding MarR family transcriptional regulator
LDQCIFTTVRKANRVLFRRYQDALSPTGVSIVQLSILRALQRHGPLSLSRLAEDLAMERTSLYRTLEPMRGNGLVKISSADIGRSKIAELTIEGQATIDCVMPFWAKAQKQVLKEIDVDNWQQVQQLLNSVAKLPV